MLSEESEENHCKTVQVLLSLAASYFDLATGYLDFFWSVKISAEVLNQLSLDTSARLVCQHMIFLYCTLCCHISFFFFFFFFFFLGGGFTALSRIFHLYRADRSSKVGENRRTRRKITWPSVSRTWLSHIWLERGSNHSDEKPNGLRVNSLIQ